MGVFGRVRPDFAEAGTSGVADQINLVASRIEAVAHIGCLHRPVPVGEERAVIDGPVGRNVGDGHRDDSPVVLRCCRQPKLDRFAGYAGGRRRRREDEIRRLNGQNPLQMDFHQAGIADTQGLICRIDVHNGLIGRAVIEPGDGVRRHGSACGSQCQNNEGRCAQRR